MSTVRRVLIPCGGRGTRMMELTRGSPKELLPVAGVPLLVRVLEECRASGITDALIVIAPGKEEIVKVVESPSASDRIPGRIDFVTQTEARGLADAIRLGRDFARGEPMAVALPDNLFSGAAPGLLQVIEEFVASQKNVVAIVEITAEESRKRGPTAVYSGELAADEYLISDIPSKRARTATFSTDGAASAFTGVGRYVFTPEVFETIDQTESALPPGAELDDVPVMQRLLAGGRLIGRRIQGKFYDVGLVDGYRDADAEFRANERRRRQPPRDN